MSANPESRWFGQTAVAPEEKTARVGAVFSSVAENYDIMNDLMSCGLHRLWKNHLVARMRPRAGEIIVDVAGGTGDIAIRCASTLARQHSASSPRKRGSSCAASAAHKSPAPRGPVTHEVSDRLDSRFRGNDSIGKASITVCDINEAMMRVGRAKAIDAGFLDEIRWVVCDAEKLPFSDHSVDLACIAFGLRNVTHIDDALAEFARILAPGGRFYCMEFSPGITPLLKPFYDAYSFSVLPWLGDAVANDREAYQYLAESIRAFPDQKTLAQRMKNAGFENVRYDNLLGGIVAIHAGWLL